MSALIYFIFVLKVKDMNKILTLIICAGSVIALTTSCKKCATCTTLSDDPETFGETISEEVCGSGREYTDLVTIYERGAWTCTED